RQQRRTGVSFALYRRRWRLIGLWRAPVGRTPGGMAGPNVGLSKNAGGTTRDGWGDDRCPRAAAAHESTRCRSRVTRAALRDGRDESARTVMCEEIGAPLSGWKLVITRTARIRC